MEENKNSSHYNSTDIQKYLEGSLSASEMHAIEKAALEDPFLADAIEGMQNNLGEQGAKSFNNEVNELNERLQKRINQKEKIIAIAPGRLWQSIAAALVLLIGSTLLIYNYVIKNSGKNTTVASAKEKIKTDSVIPGNSVVTVPAKTDSSSVSDLTATEKNKKEGLRKIKPKQNFADKEASDKKISAEERASVKIAKPENASYDIAERKAAITIKTDSLNYDSLKKQSASNNAPGASLQGKVAGVTVLASRQYNNNVVQGKVVDNYRNPVVGASVMLKNKKNGTSTDENGFFKLNANTKDSLTNVVVNSVGFQSANVTLNNNASPNLIQLQPSTSALSEVVVVGYSAKKEDDDNEDETASSPKKEKEISFKAEPSIGWPAFNDYINQNKKITTDDSARKGKEIISFLVDTANKLSSFKIKKSLSPAHDAQAIRLIRQGPSWKLLKRKKTKITLAIEF